jgi:hypothetical protein
VAVGNDAVLTYNGTGWSEQKLPVQLSGVSCASADFCAAKDTQGQLYTFNGTAWSASTAPPTISLKPQAPGPELECYSPDVCMTAAIVTSGTQHLAEEATFNGSSWSQPVQIGTVSPLGLVQALSCTAAGNCLFSDEAPSSAVFSDVDGHWTRQAFNPVPVSAPERNRIVTACSTGGFCAALSMYSSDVMWSPDPFGIG